MSNLDDNLLVPDSVVVFPPINANDDVADEDSGDDKYVVMDNLPGSSLQTQAEVIFNREIYENADDADDDKDEIPLATFIRYKKRQKRNDWVLEDMSNKFPTWQYECVVMTHPLDIFNLFFDDLLWEMMTK